MTSAKMKESSFVVVCFAHFLMVSLAAGNNTTLSTGMELPEPTPTGLLSTGLTTTNATATLPVSSTGTTAGDPESSSSYGEEVTRMTEPSISRLVMSISYTITKSKAVSTSSTTAGGHGDGIATMAPTMVTFSTAAKPSSFSDTTYFSTSSDITTIIGVESETPVISLSLPSATLSPSLSTAFKDQNRRSSGTPSPTRMTTTTVALITTPKPTTSSMAIGDSTSVVAPSMMSVPMSTSTSSATSDVGTTSTTPPNTESILIPASSPGVAVSPSSSPAAEGDSGHSTRSLPLIIGSVYSIIVLVLTSICQLAFCCSSKSDYKVYIFMHINIVASLMCGSIFLLAGTAESAWRVTTTCKAISGLTTYFLLVPFAWFLREAIFMNFHIRGLTTPKYQVMLMLIIFCSCWILPVFVTGVVGDESAISTGEDRMLQQCWLSNDGGSVAAFLVPLAVLSLLTVSLCILLGYTLRAKKQKQPELKLLQSVRYALLSVVILLPLMVLTWVIASLHVSYGNIALGWIYLVLVLITGIVIFDLYGLFMCVKRAPILMLLCKADQINEEEEVEMTAFPNDGNNNLAEASYQSQLNPTQYFHPKPPSLKIREEIGRGAYSTVHCGELDGRPVAMKKMYRLLLVAARGQNFEQVMTNFKQECQLLEKLEHPHVVDFRGAFYDETMVEPILVMERMRENLREFLERIETNELSRQQQLKILIGMVCGLRFLHTHSPPIIHGDLTDKNVMFGKDGLVKIGDLGQSRLKANNSEYINTAQLRAIPFMPPETMQEQSCYNEKLDIFSLGVLMLEVATQQPPKVKPYDNSVTPEIQRHAEDLSKLEEDHPLKLLVLSCLKDAPKERPDIVTVHTQLLAKVEGTTMGHCDAVNLEPLHEEKGRMLTLKTLLADKKEMLDIRKKELRPFETECGLFGEKIRAKAQQLRLDLDRLENLCKFLQERLDEEMNQEMSAENGASCDSERQKPLEQEVWYKDDISPKAESCIMKSCPVGAFIVRKPRSSTDFHVYTLVVWNEGVKRYRISHVKGLYKFPDMHMHMLQFASVQDLVHFFTLHPLVSGVTLRPMNVTEYCAKHKEQMRMGAPAEESDSQPAAETKDETLSTIEDSTSQLEESPEQVKLDLSVT